MVSSRFDNRSTHLGRDDYTGVIVRFEDLPFGTERTIARWLDLLAGTFPSSTMA